MEYFEYHIDENSTLAGEISNSRDVVGDPNVVNGTKRVYDYRVETFSILATIDDCVHDVTLSIQSNEPLMFQYYKGLFLEKFKEQQD